jgi:cyclopropane fatty-acyl-phospholipid synthase-like methyltransferase
MTMDNTEQIEFWNGAQGVNCAANDARFARLLRPFTEALFERAGVGAGERVLDVGCGCGETTARLSGMAAAVVGIDVSAATADRGSAGHDDEEEQR